MKPTDQLNIDIADFKQQVLIQNLYVLHYFFKDDVESFYKNASRYVAIVENGTQVDKRVFNQVISRMRATNKYCSISRHDMENLFSHPRQKMRFNYKQHLDKLVDERELAIFNHGSLKTKAMDEAEHFARLFFIPKHVLQNYLANFDSIEDAFKDAKQQASKRVRNRIEKKISRTDDESIVLLDKAIDLMERTKNMKLTKPQESAIEKRLAIIEKLTGEIKALFEGKSESEACTFSESTLDEIANKKDVLTAPKKRAPAPPSVETPVQPPDDIPDIPDDIPDVPASAPRSKWISDLSKRLPELVDQNLSPSFANSVARVFKIGQHFETDAMPSGAIGACDYVLQRELMASIVQAYKERKFDPSETDREEWTAFYAKAKALSLA